MAQNVSLTQRQIEAISRVAQGEFGAAPNKNDLYNGIRGVVDTIVNRTSAGTYGGDDVESVVNHPGAFEPVTRRAAGDWQNLKPASAAVKAIVAERLAELSQGAPTRRFTFFDNPKEVKDREGKLASKATVDRSRLGLVNPDAQLVGPLGGYAHNYYDRPGERAPRGFEVSLEDDAQGRVKDWSKAYSGMGWGNLNDSPSELNALSRQYPAYGPKSVYGDPTDTMPSAPVSPVERAPLQPSVQSMEAPGFNFSQSYGSLGYNPQFAQPVTPQNPPAATQPGWGSIAGEAIGAARPPASVPNYGPDYGNAGPGMPAVSTPDYTTGSNGTLQQSPPSVMGPTGASLAGQAIGAAAPLSALPQFSSMRPTMSGVDQAIAAADEAAAKNAELAQAYKPPSIRDDMYGVAPTVEPPSAAVTAPKAPQVQKAMPRIAPKAVPMQPATPTTPQGLAKYGLGDRPQSPGEALSQQIGTPQDFMGSSTSPQAFGKAVAAVAAINGSKDAQTYAGLLSDPHLGGVAFDALNNEYAKATNQMQTPTLYDRAALSPIGRMLGMTANQLPFNGYGAANSPMPMNGMYVQGANGQPTYATYSQDQQRALQNSSGLLGSLGNMLGIGAGANNGWGGAGSMGYGAGTSGLY